MEILKLKVVVVSRTETCKEINYHWSLAYFVASFCHNTKHRGLPCIIYSRDLQQAVRDPWRGLRVSAGGAAKLCLKNHFSKVFLICLKIDINFN